jgi:hypothetical protein
LILLTNRTLTPLAHSIHTPILGWWTLHAAVVLHQVMKVIAEDTVALAGSPLQTFAVQNMDIAAGVPDQTTPFQTSRRDADGRAPRPQHRRDELTLTFLFAKNVEDLNRR